MNAGLFRSKGVLVAIKNRDDGCSELLGYVIGDSESETTWSHLFRQLKALGLSIVGLAPTVAPLIGYLSWLRRRFLLLKKCHDKMKQ